MYLCRPKLIKNDMMKRRFLTLALLAALVCQVVIAADDAFTTKGDGTTYSIRTLAEMEEAGVLAYAMAVWPPVFEMTKSVTIAEGDKFVMDDAIALQFRENVCLTIEGEADFQLEEGSKFEPAFNQPEVLGTSIRIKSSSTTEMSHCSFSSLGVEVMGDGAVNLDNCYFAIHDGSTAAALYFMSDGAPSVIQYCEFHSCQKAAIGSAANASRPMTISHCTFDRNSATNGNIPQINITAANPLVIDRCTVEGNPENTMVGGIGISNFMSYDADITISNCTVEDNRYGIGLVGPAAKVRIEDCKLLNNRYETNAMNGGSGISLYDPYQLTEAVMTGNHIEGSLWGVTVIGCKKVNLGCLESGDDYNPGENVFEDNGNNGQLYDLYNNSANTIYAQGNTWNVSEQTEEQIETVIYHKHDDPSLGEVIYWPAATETGIGTVNGSLFESVALQLGFTVHDCYDLQGRKLPAPQKGLNIVNGKKVLR